jgi:hypothetical protein
MWVPLVPLGLALVGSAVPLVGSGFSVWGMALVWVAAIAAVTLARAVARPRRPPWSSWTSLAS